MWQLLGFKMHSGHLWYNISAVLIPLHVCDNFHCQVSGDI